MGVIVERDGANFGRIKYNKGAYSREGRWVHGAVDKSTGDGYLLPYPNNKPDAAVLLPLIKRWVMPGTVVYTDRWEA